ncbi:alpha/beta hydrolase [Telmatospirillum siberiense]|uniref:Palmitoyl-protein thioesterase ABHD10, mitochondrial n=1 Tax=Telmatospirillum siberiense TaxID=382514 RepID=A0A2N3PQX5_9PROT|nr:alpha/beta hydrolase [Telmatospirillum siberiense]PKU22796.1 alpha/beta hydrolase [Telmatospirillum siberiense]
MTDNEKAAPTTGTAGILARGGDTTIAYSKLAGKNPGIVFLHGFKSDKSGSKALALEEFCRRRGQAFVRFDATGHGESSGRFEDGTIGQWADDAVAVLDSLTEGPQILVGSSMGGWLMLLAALARRDRVAGLLGLAAAPDFTEELIFDAFSLEQKQTLLRESRVLIDDAYGEAPYSISRRLIEDGRQHLLLHGPINLTCPIRLIHGQKDEDVPWRTALRLQEHLISDDVEVTIVKSSSHRLSEPHDMERMEAVLEGLLRKVENS